MKKTLLFSFLLTAILGGSFVTLYFFTYPGATFANTDSNTSTYEMPYPGMLPDNPLYLLKETRDYMVEFGTRDPLSKAELNLVCADKHVSMGVELVKKGKNALALRSLASSEEHTARAIDVLEKSIKQGASPSGELMVKLKESNAEHLTTYLRLMGELPEGDTEKLQDIIMVTEKLQERIKTL
ncbi:hypothetical protein HGB07_02415 [Candidatus Roizmanbacteria bacterium]|nr:hypothetical protein [Candidatus Roizmanbacteria bacterium]